MDGIEIHDTHPQGVLTFDLRDILDAIGPDALTLYWWCHKVEALGGPGPAGDAYRLLTSDGAPKRPVHGRELRHAAQHIVQILDGTFRGFPQPFQVGGELAGDDANSGRPVSAPEITIVAFDSSHWEVYGAAKVLSRVRHRFLDVREVRRTPYV
jgi:hypothetical protein